MLKRLIDIILSLFGIILVLPFFPIIALLIKLDSKGPVFYLADRVGKDMKPFKMYKLRTMFDTPVCDGQSLCPQYDPRVTTFGRFLRRTKLNEFPQLLNILKGEMTFVGPRPESPDLAELYPEKAKEIFSVKPGLVGPNQILGRNEEEIYPPGVDNKKYYINEILPKKVEVDLEYIKCPTFFKDLQYIFMGVKETLTGALSRSHIQDNSSQIYLLITDGILSIISFILAYALCFRDLSQDSNINIIYSAIFLTIFLVIRLCCFVFFGMYTSLIRYISYHDVLAVLKGVTSGSLFLVVFGFLSGLNGHLKLFAIIDWSFLILVLSCLRFALRFYWEQKNKKTTEEKKHRVLIFGAGATGNLACRAVNSEPESPFEVVGFIDDAPGKYGKRLNGLKVLGNRYHIKELAQLYKVEEILLALGDDHADEISKIVEICQEAGLRYRIFSSVTNVDTTNRYNFPVRTLGLSDVLDLKRIHMDNAAVKRILADKAVLVNGSGGALGLELCRQILQIGCRKLIIVDRYESYLTELASGLFSLYSKEMVVPVLLGADGTNRLEEIFGRYQPNVIFHASMKKYVPFFEVDNDDIVQTNYVRTFNLAKISANFGCQYFIMISSFAAATGGNSIADSLRKAELSLQQFFRGSNCRLIISRVCDIVENRGGIISVIENQIRKQETVILPSPEAQACLISKDSAAEFILQTLVEAGRNGSEEGVFVCEPGSPVPLIQVAEKLANLYGMKLGPDLLVKYLNLSEKHMTSQANSMQQLKSTSCQGIRFLKENLSSDCRKSALKDFFSPKDSCLSPLPEN